MHIIIDLLNNSFYSADNGNRLGINVNGVIITPDAFDVPFIYKMMGCRMQTSACVIVPQSILEMIFEDFEYHLTIIDYHTNKIILKQI